MSDSVMATISTLQTSMFVTSGTWNFSFIGSIPKELLVKVPSDNAIMNTNRNFPSSGVRPLPDELRRLIYKGNKPKRGGKRNDKVDPLEIVKAPKKMKKQANKPRSPSPVV